MPGIIGRIESLPHTANAELANARRQLKYHDWYRDSEVWSDQGFACTHTSTGILDAEKYPRELEGFFAWIDGECYNIEKVGAISGIEAIHFADLLCQAWKRNVLESVLQHIDGVFVAVLYDKSSRRVCFISDRYGSRPFYLWQEGAHFAWSSEVKGFFGMSDFQKNIHPDAPKCLLEFGHLPGELTWFKDVRLMPAATLICLPVDKPEQSKTTRYWKWSAVPLQKVSFEEAVNRTAELVQKAVAKTFTPKLNMGLLLSGGIDSRMILAALPAGAAMPLFTFGDQRSDDVVIARQIAEKVKMPHHILPLSEENWWETRPRATWQTDGMVNAFHLHNTVHHEAMRPYCDIVLNGHSINLGGYLITQNNRRVDQQYARQCFGDYAGLTGWEDAYFDTDRQSPYFFEAVIRHKSLYGGVNFAKTIEMRRPFIDNALLDFVYGLPDEYKTNYRLYLQVVMRISPELFGEIPWQKTGFPVKHANLTRWYLQFKIKEIRRRLGLQRTAFPIADYANWMRQPASATYFSALLNPVKALYPEVIREDFLKKYLQPHLNRQGNHIEKIGRAATMEWWLQKVFG